MSNAKSGTTRTQTSRDQATASPSTISNNSPNITKGNSATHNNREESVEDDGTTTISAKAVVFSLLSPQSNVHLTKVGQKLHKAKRAIVVTGAGISVSGGIPDFRSAQGLYSLVQKRYQFSSSSSSSGSTGGIRQGKDLFDASLFNDSTTTRLFYAFMGELKERVDQAQPTPTHHFIKGLDKTHSKLLRCYTQNIDGFEGRIGMNADLSDPKSCKVVMLHGDLDRVGCTLCPTLSPFDKGILGKFKEGETAACGKCMLTAAQRKALGKRDVSVGLLRPNIVLYNEHHSKGDDISAILDGDIRRKPDMLIIMGTTLKVVGIKSLVKCVAQAVHANGGIVVMINRDLILGREWDDVFDYFIQGECDKVIEMLEQVRSSLPEPKKKQTKSVSQSLPKPVKVNKNESLSQPILGKEPAKENAPHPSPTLMNGIRGMLSTPKATVSKKATTSTSTLAPTARKGSSVLPKVQKPVRTTVRSTASVIVPSL